MQLIYTINFNENNFTKIYLKLVERVISLKRLHD